MKNKSILLTIFIFFLIIIFIELSFIFFYSFYGQNKKNDYYLKKNFRCELESPIIDLLRKDGILQSSTLSYVIRTKISAIESNENFLYIKIKSGPNIRTLVYPHTNLDKIFVYYNDKKISIENLNVNDEVEITFEIDNLKPEEDIKSLKIKKL